MKEIILYVTSFSQIDYCLSYLNRYGNQGAYKFIFIIKSAYVNDQFINEMLKIVSDYGEVKLIDKRPISNLADMSFTQRMLWNLSFLSLKLYKYKPSIVFIRTKVDFFAFLMATIYFKSQIIMIPDGARDFLHQQRKNMISYFLLIHFQRIKLLTLGYNSNVIPKLLNMKKINIFENYLRHLRQKCAINLNCKALIIAHAYSDRWKEISQEKEIDYYTNLIQLFKTRYGFSKNDIRFLAHPRTSTSLFSLYRNGLGRLVKVEDIGKVAAECYITIKPDVIIGGLSTSLLLAKQFKGIKVFYFDFPLIPKKDFDILKHIDIKNSFHQLGINNFLETI